MFHSLLPKRDDEINSDIVIKSKGLVKNTPKPRTVSLEEGGDDVAKSAITTLPCATPIQYDITRSSDAARVHRGKLIKPGASRTRRKRGPRPAPQGPRPHQQGLRPVSLGL